MRRGRFLAPGWEAGRRSGVYHVVSRVVDRRFVLGEEEKAQFVRLMRLYERFCGVRVLSYCVMSNHFHILVEVPVRPTEGLSEREFLARLALLYGDKHVDEVRHLLNQRKTAGDQSGQRAIMEKYLYRMWDLSQFMKTLKQRFTQWFNRRHERRGTLWEDRFKSVIVEDGYAARVIAAYIDLNPVRGGIVSHPGEYRWCSFSEAVAGRPAARSGLERVMGEYESLTGAVEQPRPWPETLESYRKILLSDGREVVRQNEQTGELEVARRGMAAHHDESIRKASGTLRLAELLRRKVRYFVDGGVIGSRSFVDGIWGERKSWFGKGRSSGARPIPECDAPLFSLRDLKVRAIE